MSNEILDSLKDLLAQLEEEASLVTFDEMRKEVEKIAAEVGRMYSRFFVDLEDILEDLLQEDEYSQTPGVIASHLGLNPAWKPLSTETGPNSKYRPWISTKAIYGGPLGFYHGISSLKKSPTPSFAEYISDLAGRKNAVNRAFGAPRLSFKMIEDGRESILNVKYGKVSAPRTERGQGITTRKTGKLGFSTGDGRKERLFSALILLFPRLLGKPLEEWEVVDALIKSRVVSYKQFVKINGTSAYGAGGKRGRGRPIRAIIAPTVSKHLEEIRTFVQNSL